MACADHVDHVIVIKVGTSTLLDEAGALDTAYVGELCEQVVALKARGKRPVVVTSGAVGCGMKRLGLSERPSDMPTLQACAAAGQVLLAEAYEAALAPAGVVAAQVLLTRNDVLARDAYLNAKNTLVRLVELGAVPVVNENDTVSVEEVSFGDNDMLGALVATMLDAERYVILSDIDGLYDKDPRTHDDAQLVEEVTAIDGALMQAASGAGTGVGTGGMRTKLRAARALLAAGIPMTITAGRVPGCVLGALEGSLRATHFTPVGHTREPARKLWIGLATTPRGTVVVDDGAVEALEVAGASLLPVGVVEVTGAFDEGDVVNVTNREGALLARGISRYSGDDLRRVAGLQSSVIARFLPQKADVPAIHRDELFIL
jgi:glutamate 5-kinase